MSQRVAFVILAATCVACLTLFPPAPLAVALALTGAACLDAARHLRLTGATG